MKKMWNKVYMLLSIYNLLDQGQFHLKVLGQLKGLKLKIISQMQFRN